MVNKFSLQINNISKIYKLYNSPLSRLQEVLFPFTEKQFKEFSALKNISFKAKPGEIIGIIGKNGSGKSTLLQIIAGILSPSSGNLHVNGKVSALLELGAGFNPELTGLENVYFSTSLQGFTSKETEANLTQILSFADIGEFIHQPVKSYSSGMYLRLAFAIAINIDPDILIIDEALAVGDFRFQQKCFRKIRDFKEAGKTILFVSHDTGSIIEFCSQTLWLMDGKVMAMGRPTNICRDYIAYMSQEVMPPLLHKNSPSNLQQSSPEFTLSKSTNQLDWEDTKLCTSFGKRKAIIDKITFYNKNSMQKLKVFEGGQAVFLYLAIKVIQNIKSPIIGFHVSDAKGVHVLGMNTFVLGQHIDEFQPGEIKTVRFEFIFPYLKTGTYSFSPAIADGTQQENSQQHWVHDAYTFDIASQDDSQKLGHYLAIKDDFQITIH